MATEAALSLLSEVMTCGGGGMRHRGRMRSSDESLRMAGHATCEARAQCFTCPSIVTRPSPECGMQRSGNKDARRRHSDWSLPRHEETEGSEPPFVALRRSNAAWRLAQRCRRSATLC